MYACMYVCMHACMYVRTYVRTYVCMYVFIYIYVHLCKFIHFSIDLVFIYFNVYICYLFVYSISFCYCNCFGLLTSLFMHLQPKLITRYTFLFMFIYRGPFGYISPPGLRAHISISTHHTFSLGLGSGFARQVK